ncbi:MAG TPA: SMC-Scp complex subunit ScpB [Candidatus Paceibacterota bacterium]|nr:SMC-Scp complex subunit ScpB [Candidatus Paceibacterota bacterium]
MTDEQLAGLEALLFIHGEPLAFEKIGKVLGIKAEEARALADALSAKLAEAPRGLVLIMNGDEVQLSTKPQFAGLVESFVKAELSEDLSPASLETLAIVAYFGPISRSRIDYQRGVNSSFILRSLLIRGLIDRAPDPHRANAYLYRPSFELLKYLGVGGQADLPEAARFRKLLEDFEAQTPVSETPIAPLTETPNNP